MGVNLSVLLSFNFNYRVCCCFKKKMAAWSTKIGYHIPSYSIIKNANNIAWQPKHQRTEAQKLIFALWLAFEQLIRFSFCWDSFTIDQSDLPRSNHFSPLFSSLFFTFLFHPHLSIRLTSLQVFILNFLEEHILNGLKERVIERKRILAQKPI